MENDALNDESLYHIANARSMQDMLTAGGEVSRILSAFEDRPGQVEMAQAVSEAFTSDQVLVVEAGTGVGKSLAYGLPAAVWSLSTKTRVVISSATINLQEQLVKKDLPLVGKVLGKALRVVLVKGRANYLCKRRLQEIVRQPMLMGVDKFEKFMSKITSWADRTSDGSRSDLDFSVKEELWRQVCSDPDMCFSHKCPLREDCFFVNARKEAEKAQILVVNHHLLFAQLAMGLQSGDRIRRSVLPKFDRVIVDEAHEIEDAASHFFGLRLTLNGVMRDLARLQPIKGGADGLFSKSITKPVFDMSRSESEISDEQTEDLRKSTVLAVEDVKNAFRQAFDALASVALEQNSSIGVAESQLRLTEKMVNSSAWRDARDAFLHAVELTELLSARIEDFSERLIDFKDRENLRLEIRSSGFRIREIAQQTRQLVSDDTDGLVRWVEIDRRQRKRIGIVSAPLRVSELLDRNLYGQMRTAVLTSATLSVSGTFDFVCDRLGVNMQPEERRRLLQVPSPFDFASQVRLGVATDLPVPEEPAFEREMSKAVYRAVQASGGGALVLFTSWSLMTRIYELLRDRMEEVGILCLCQGQMPRYRLLDTFRDNESSVLFGTDSFWQGVDVIGRALRNVVIVKLPFDVPGEPLKQARMEELEKQGKSSFMSYMLPRAVLKLKQGFGRLIRSSSDWGVVTVLDQRIATKGYGRKFIKSLPSATMVMGDLEGTCSQLAAFIEERSGGETSPE